MSAILLHSSLFVRDVEVASQLDRDNVELSARPVLVDLRKMVEDQARIIETRALNAPHPVLDVIVSVDNNVPDKVYLDETYTYRVSRADIDNVDDIFANRFIFQILMNVCSRSLPSDTESLRI